MSLAVRDVLRRPARSLARALERAGRRAAPRLAACAGVLSLAAAGAAAQSPDAAAPARYLDHRALELRLAELAAAHPELVRVAVVGSSLGGRALSALVIAAPGEPPVEQRNGLLVVGGLDGRRLVDSAVLLEAVAALLAGDAGHAAQEDDGETGGAGGEARDADGEARDAAASLAARLGDRVLVVLPRANPDGAEALLGLLGAAREQAGNGRPDDRDRDGRFDEDGGEDLDGDGFVSSMRVPDPEGEWVLDAHDPRAMRKAKPERGERGTHRLLEEGRDDDADGEHGEDGTEGVHPDRNFPHGWPEHSPGAGAYPLSEPESRALADLVLAWPGLLGVLVVGAQDTLAELPKKAGNVPRGRGFDEPLDGVHEDDLAALKELKRRCELGAADGKTLSVKGDGLTDGSFLAWAYHQAGRWPIGVKAWAPPAELPKDAAKSEGEPTKEGEVKPEGESPGSDASSPVPAAVLAWLDTERGGEGLLPWRSFEHPQLGAVEIGGLVPGTLVNPPYAEALAAGRRLAPFLLETLDALPRVAVETLEAERLAEGVYAVSAALANTGVLPTASRLAASARTMLPLRVTLELPDGAQRLAGPAQTLVDRLDGGGGRRELRWTVSARPGDVLRVVAAAPGLAPAERGITLP